MRTKKNRWKLTTNEKTIGEASSMDELAALIGCTKQHIYQRLNDGKFTYKKITYTVIDKLD